MLEKLIKLLIICLTAVGIIFIMGKFPPVAVSMTAMVIVFLFLFFKDNY